MAHKGDQQQEEKNLFCAFLEICPQFCKEDIRDWKPAEHDPPDMICTTVTAKIVGVEICQWSHPQEFSASKQRQRIDQTLLKAIEPQPINKTKYIQMVCFFPKAKVQITPRQYPEFRESLLGFIDYVDETWPTRYPSQRHTSGEWRRFRPLNEHLECIRFAPGEALSDGIDWILPAGLVTSFDDRTMTEPLLELIQRKKKQCASLKTACDKLYLVVAYDQALAYCSPINTPRRSVAETAEEAADMLRMDPGPFNGAFLFLALEPGSKLHRLL